MGNLGLERGADVKVKQALFLVPHAVREVAAVRRSIRSAAVRW
jgi:hypothetical protein